MNIKNIIVCFFLSVACPFVYADRVYLKNGEFFDGIIIERTDQFIQVKTGGAPVYLTMDQIEKIIEGDVEPEMAEFVQQATVQQISQPREVPVPQAADNKLIDGKDGQYYYQKARADLHSGRLKESMSNLYLAASLGVEDSEGLKEQINQAVKILEAVESKKSDLKKFVDQMDPGTQKIVIRIAQIVGLIFLGFILFKFFTREKKISTVSPLFKAKAHHLVQAVEEGNFVKPGPNKRICAFFIDTIVIFMIPGILVSFFAGQLYCSLLWLVYLLLKDSINGQSLGKKWMGIRIVDVNNQPAGPSQTVMRNLYWVLVCVLPLFHPYLGVLSLAIILFEFVSFLRNPIGQRFGDKISLTRVTDLKPLFADWICLLLSVGIVIFGVAIYSVSAVVLTKFFNRPATVLMAKDEFRDPAGRFTFKVPQGFILDAENSKDNTFVLKKADGKQSITVLLADSGEPIQMSPQELDAFAASVLAAKFKVDVRDMMAYSSISQSFVSGKHATVFTYQSDAGKIVSVCVVNGQLFCEIAFIFGEGQVDQDLITEFLMLFKFLK